MPRNTFFQNYGASGEQRLVENLIIEAIKIFGKDVLYLPRSVENLDEIYLEDSVSEYNSQHMIEMYVKNVDSYSGDGNFFSKFNLEIRDQVTLTVARRSFYNEVGQYANLERPREGDLIYFPFAERNRLFRINYVENEAVFYQLGSLQVWDITCEMFEYSNEVLNTGIPEVDNLQREYSTNLFDFGILTSDGYLLTDNDGFAIAQARYSLDTQLGDIFADNDEIQSESDDIIDFSEINPFSEEPY